MLCLYKVDYKVALHCASTQKISVVESNFVSKTLNTTLNHFESTYLVRDIAILNLTGSFVYNKLQQYATKKELSSSWKKEALE